MDLRDALGIGAGSVAAFTGGGGKTSLCLHLAAACTGAGLRTIYTTTAHIYPPPMPAVALAAAGAGAAGPGGSVTRSGGSNSPSGGSAAGSGGSVRLAAGCGASDSPSDGSAAGPGGSALPGAGSGGSNSPSGGSAAGSGGSAAAPGGSVRLAAGSGAFAAGPGASVTGTGASAAAPGAGDLAAVRACLAAGGPCCVYGAPGPEGKLAGIAPALVGGLLAVADAVLVEADGSRGLPLKCPGDHEPVIPPAANLVVPVAGITALGQPLDERWVHRPERAAALLGVPPGTTITPEHVARLLLDPAGCTRGRPSAARVIPVINQVDSAAALAAARAVAAALLHLGATRVVLTAAATAQVVRAVLDG